MIRRFWSDLPAFPNSASGTSSPAFGRPGTPRKVARAADQVMVVMMAVPGLDLVPRRPVDPGDPLHQLPFLENRNEPKHGGKVAAFPGYLFVNVRQGEGNGAGIEQLNNGDAPVGRAQPVLPQPCGAVDHRMRVRFRLRGHKCLYHRPG
jgi:hypothetical protein